MTNKKEELLDYEIAKAETIRRRKFTPFRKVIGQIPKEVDMAAWTHEQWLNLLRFVSVFIEKDGEDESFKFTDEKRAFLNDTLSIPDHPFQELIYRVDRWPEEHDNKEYRYRFQAMARTILSYLKEHPALINENMRILIASYPKRLGWVMKQYKIVNTRAGEIIQRDQGTDTQSDVRTPLPSIQTKLMNSLLIMSDMYEMIAAGVSEKEIKKMTANEKIKALKDLSFIFTTSKKGNPTNHLTQININTKDARGVEEAMMDYVKKTQEK